MRKQAAACTAVKRVRAVDAGYPQVADESARNCTVIDHSR